MLAKCKQLIFFIIKSRKRVVGDRGKKNQREKQKSDDNKEVNRRLKLKERQPNG